ncbi:hypothetical protein AVEN_250334-1 [Araneus ventricosus]|uniref:Transposable element Tc3 transposase n=1 Tax=Araneus ventricosus TaxID=182803 RepID=A0A4Y2ULE4_ARAVE|nr:hypothetical protein AVEN_250334-1 [Araneus ventricosus]
MAVDNAGPWNILWRDEDHFHLQGSVNSQNCRIYTRENTFQMQLLSLHSQKVTLWCWFTAAFIVGPFIFKEIDASGLINVMKLLNLRFGNDRIISRHFPTAWPPLSPDLSPCDFWLWDYLKDVVYEGLIGNLADLKNSITQHIHNFTTETLQSVVEHAVLRFQLIGNTADSILNNS